MTDAPRLSLLRMKAKAFMAEAGDAAHERVQMSYPIKRRILAMRPDCPPELLQAADALFARLASAPPMGFRDGLEALLYLINTADMIPDGNSKIGLEDDLILLREACRNAGITLATKTVPPPELQGSGSLRAALLARRRESPES